MNCIPNGIDVWNFVSEEFDRIERDGNSQDQRMGKHLQGSRQMDHAKSLEKPECRNGRIQIEAGRKSSAEREAECFDRIHELHINKRRRLQRTYVMHASVIFIYVLRRSPRDARGASPKRSARSLPGWKTGAASAVRA